MAFGNLISDGTEIAAGTNGKIFAFDLKSVLVKDVKQVVLWADNVMDTPVTSPVVMSVLYTYLEATSPPNFAFCQQGNFLYVFINTVFYDETSRIGFEFTRNSISPTSTSSKLDVPQPAKALFIYLSKKRIADEESKRVNFELEQDIIKEKSLLGLS